MAKILIKRGTKAQITAAAQANELNAGEPYLATDTTNVAVGTASNAFVTLPSIVGAERIEIVQALPPAPDPLTLYIVMGT